MKQQIIHYRNKFAALLNKPAEDAKLCTVISNDCWAGSLYQDFGWEYRTPFIGLALMAPDYLHLLSDLKGFLHSPLRFKEFSKYDEVNVRRCDPAEHYPVGVLGSDADDIEIHFIHYHSQEEAISKWTRRIERMNWNRLAVKFAGDKDYCTPELMERFDKLDYPVRIAFSKQPYPKLSHVVQVKNYLENGAMLYRRSICYFDLPAWLTTGVIQAPTPRTVISKALYCFGA